MKERIANLQTVKESNNVERINRNQFKDDITISILNADDDDVNPAVSTSATAAFRSVPSAERGLSRRDSWFNFDRCFHDGV